MLIEDGRIAEVGPRLRARGAEVIEAADTIVMPGFVDSHRHAWQAILRYSDTLLAADRLLDGARPDDIYAATLIGLLGGVESGITTVVDWCDVANEPSLLEAAVQAHRDSGLRTILVRPSIDDLSTNQEVGPLTDVAAGSEDVETARLDELVSGWGECHERGLRVHAHAGRTDHVPGAVSALHRSGALGDHVTLVHCTHLDDADLDAIAQSGTRVALTPSSEMAGGLGSPPIQRLMNRGIRPGLGVDSERTTPGDIFAQMRATISLQHAEMFDLKLAGKGSLPNLLTTRQVIRYGTVDGAVAAGVGAATGSIEPGKRADIIVLRTDRPNIAPVNDPIGAVVWGMDTSNLDHVFVDGIPLMRDGDLDADVGRVRQLAAAARESLMGGHLVDSGGGVG